MHRQVSKNESGERIVDVFEWTLYIFLILQIMYMNAIYLLATKAAELKHSRRIAQSAYAKLKINVNVSM